jgi:hypothetical protein
MAGGAFSFGHHVIQTSPHFTTVGCKDHFNVELAYHLDGLIADQTARAHVPDAMLSGHTVLTAPLPNDGLDARIQVQRYYTSVAYDGQVFEFGACVRASGRAVFWGKGKGHARGDLLEFDMGRYHGSDGDDESSGRDSDGGPGSGSRRGGRRAGRGGRFGAASVGRGRGFGSNSRASTASSSSAAASAKAKAKAKAKANSKGKGGSRLTKTSGKKK